MTKIKVGQLAKELKITPKELIKVLTDLGVTAKTAASSIDEESAQVVKDILKPKEEKPKAAVEKPQVQKPEAEVKPAFMPPVAPLEKAGPKPIIIDTEDISIKDLAEKINAKPSDLIKELMKRGILATINQRVAAELAREVAAALGKEVNLRVSKAEEKVIPEVKIEKRALRPPVVTVMGHVDHGKTKLLDAIRKTKIAEGEAGGITQHIGAYQVTVGGRKVTFLDTPGHEAFTALRARGAKVTDIVVLVVAADDGVKPQTIEAINHARAAGVPIMVAINKIDKPEANPELVKRQLSELGLIPEEWGGQTVVVAVSAKQGTGIGELLEMILLVADLQELKADPDALAMGVVIESRLDKGKGPVATVLVKNGTLKVGDVFTIGSTYGKVRALFTEAGARLEKAGPSTPVEVLGCLEVPKAGDLLQVVSSEKEARTLAEQRKEIEDKVMRGKVVTLEDFSKHVEEGMQQDLNIVLKADVQGSIDALTKSLSELRVGNMGIQVIHSGVGAITESDVMLAKASNAILLGFNVVFEGGAENLAVEEGVEVRRYDIIYKLLDDLKLAMEGMLKPEYQEVILGHAEVRQLFRYSKVGVIAGCYVTDGKMVRGAGLRVFRNQEKIYEGKLESLKRFKEDVKTVEQNYECGIAIPGYTNFEVG
ncbi:MAG: translation initiation factor IF-2, partial [Candidatus Margulisiibacteriota bacterium]